MKPVIVRAGDLTQLWYTVNNALLWATGEELDYVSSLDVMMTDCISVVDSCDYTLDIGRDLWLTPVRWTTLIRQYIDPERLERWLDGVERVGLKGRGINMMDFKSVGTTVVDSSARATRRRWGGCLRSVVYRPFPEPTISLVNRTSYLGYIAGLDLMVGHKLAAEVANILNISVSDIRFRWYCDTLQMHGFKSFAYIFATGQGKYLEGKRPKLEAKYPTWKLMRNWWARIKRHDDQGLKYSDMKYGAEIRIRRRYHATIGEERYTDEKYKPQYPLSTPIESLTLDKIWR